MSTAQPPFRPRRTGWGVLAAAWLAASILLWFWLDRTPGDDLRATLGRGQFWALELQFVLLVFLSVLQIPKLVRALGLRGRDLAAPLAASLVMLFLVTQVAPRTNRIYYDEHIYQGVGQSLADLRLAQMCNDGNVEYGSLACARGDYNKQPYGFPFLLSVGYQIAGVDESVAFAINAFAASLFVWAVFFVTTALTGRTLAGHYAAIVAALIPEHLRWSHTAAAEPTAALAGAVAVLAALAFVRLRSDAALLWMVVATVFAMQFRPESILIVAVVALILVVFAAPELGRPRLWWAGLFGFALVSVHVGHLVAVQNERWGATGDRWSAAFVVENLRTNGTFFLGDGRFPVAYSLLAVAALVWHRPRRQTFVALVYFLLYWGIFLFFYAGSYNFGADDRFTLVVSAPLAVLAGIGVSAVLDVARAHALFPARWAAPVALAALTAQFLWYLPFVRSIGEEAWAARADVAFARQVVESLPRNAIVLTQNPTLFHVLGQSAAQVSLAAGDPAYVERELAPRYAGGVYLNWNYWCNVADPVQTSYCTSVLARYPHSMMQEARERNYRYAMYRLELTPSEPVNHGSGRYRRSDPR